MTQVQEEMRDEIDRAVAAADLLFDDPEAPSLFEPTTLESAKAAVARLGERFAELPGTARLALQRARVGGEMLSSDRLQGLSEIVQNADDVGATRLTFKLNEPELLAMHNGRPLNLRDVWALSTPWVTTKTMEADSVGRFGIGLATLRALSPTLDVFCGPYAIRIDGSTLSSLDPVDGTEILLGDGSTTTLRLSLHPGVLDSEDIVRWLEDWDDSALLFCQSVSQVSFENRGRPERMLGLEWNEIESVQTRLGGHPVVASRAIAKAGDDRRWLRWVADVAPPKHLTRQHKEIGTSMPVGVVVPLHEERTGRVHAGLPLARTQVPLVANAHFDPIAGRQGLLDNDWNSKLIDLVADLWVELVLDLFKTDPQSAWRLIPLPKDSDTEGPNLLDQALLSRARTLLPEQLTFSIAGDLALSVTAHEVELLEGVLADDQIAGLAGSVASLPAEVRDGSGCWRRVLDDWRSVGAALLPPVTVEQAVSLLERDIKVSQAVSIAAAAINDGLEAELSTPAWVADEDGQRFAPPSSQSIWTFTTSNDQWALDLELARRVHPELLAQEEASNVVVEWLRGRGSLIDRIDPGAFLERLAAAGHGGHRMTTPLSDTQFLSIRDAFEALSSQQRQNIGPGIGRAILIEAFEYSTGGKRVPITASPSEVYLHKSIDREPDSFAIAADTTPGILWASSRYSTLLRSPHGRAGLGAQKFLRLLGAETAPRIMPHPLLERRYSSDARLGLPKYVVDGPRSRSEFMTAVSADYTLEDHDSPDLETILRSIADDRRAKRRRARAAAMVAVLGRAWDRIGDQAEATAAATDYGWQSKASAPAYWIWRARTVEWLDNTRAVPTAPNELWLRTPATMAVHGAGSPDYLHKDIPTDRRDVLAVLGVTGEPTMAAMVDRLAELRDLESEGVEISSADTALLYQGIAGQVGTRRQAPGHLSVARLRSRFSAGVGLIRSDRWRKPAEVFSGPPVFGHLRQFVPQVPDADRLWRALEVPQPSWRDCVDVLRQVAGLNQDGDVALESIELDTLRLLARLIDEQPLSARSRSAFARLPLRTSQGRTASRPVFVLSDPVVVEAIAPALPIWRPGGELEQFLPLIDPFEISLLGPEHVRISGTADATYDEDASELFRAAVAQLREDLVRNEPAAAASLAINWSVLETFDVFVAGQVTAHVTPPQGLGRAVAGAVEAYADPDQACLYLTDPSCLEAYESGARAVAGLFAADSRRLAQAWLAACGTARAGREARRLQPAEISSEEEKRRHAAAIKEQLGALQSETSAKSALPTRKQKTPLADPEDKSNADAVPPRQLVDPGALVVLNPDGEIVGDPSSSRRRSKSPSNADPSPVRKEGAPIRSHAAPKGYTEVDKETVGLDLARRVLRSSSSELLDLRGQRGVGADAIDELERFYELKVYEGPEPEQIRLEPSQIERAKSTSGFFLVVVSNVEGVQGNPRVRIITDPLNQLERIETRAVSFTGVRSAVSLVYELAPAEDGVEGHV